MRQTVPHSLIFLGEDLTSHTPWETAKVQQKVSEKESQRDLIFCCCFLKLHSAESAFLFPAPRRK